MASKNSRPEGYPIAWSLVILGVNPLSSITLVSRIRRCLLRPETNDYAFKYIIKFCFLLKQSLCFVLSLKDCPSKMPFFEFVFATKKYFNSKCHGKTLIIICKGERKNNRIEKCSFLHAGNWGDAQLTEHQKFHKLSESDTCYWLGFDVPQPFGIFSNRDGKRN